jgi:uncharacterized membrane protein YhaH (DUF805 family)
MSKSRRARYLAWTLTLPLSIRNCYNEIIIIATGENVMKEKGPKASRPWLTPNAKATFLTVIILVVLVAFLAALFILTVDPK